MSHINSSRRIVFVAPFGLGQKTTVWARTLPLARFLASQGHTVSILIPPWDTPQDAGKHWDDEGVLVYNLSLVGGLPGTMIRLLRQIKAIQPDIVHIVKPRAHAGLVQWSLWHIQQCQQWFNHLIPGKVGKYRPHIVLDVDDWEQAWASINNYPWHVARFLAWQEEWGIRHAHGISAASHWLVERVRSYAHQTPVLYLPNGVSEPIATHTVAPSATLFGRNIPYRPYAPSEYKTVLLFSRFVEVEPQWLADFWNVLQKEVPSIRFVIGGSAINAERDRLYQEQLGYSGVVQSSKQMTESSNGFHSNLEWLGYVESESLPELYAQVDCAIFPAANVPLNQAKCSVKLATTLLHGVPVVASAVGEQSAYGANGAAHLVSAEATPDEFAQAVANVLRTPEQQLYLSKQAREHLLTQYDWSALGARLEAFYMDLEQCV